jgi:hypothetical protein
LRRKKPHEFQLVEPVNRTESAEERRDSPEMKDQQIAALSEFIDVSPYTISWCEKNKAEKKKARVFKNIPSC